MRVSCLAMAVCALVASGVFAGASRGSNNFQFVNKRNQDMEIVKESTKQKLAFKGPLFGKLVKVKMSFEVLPDDDVNSEPGVHTALPSGAAFQNMAALSPAIAMMFPQQFALQQPNAANPHMIPLAGLGQFPTQG